LQLPFAPTLSRTREWGRAAAVIERSASRGALDDPFSRLREKVAAKRPDEGTPRLCLEFARMREGPSMTDAKSASAGALRLSGVRRVFGAYAALAGLDLEIAPGEFIALLGPSGCGKTTALNCIAGLLPLTSGSITLGERRIDQLPPEARGFGMVFQSYALFPHMSARRNIGFGLAMQGTPKDEAEKRLAEALAMVRLEAQAEKLPGQMSGGQQQRVAIARAIAIRPPVVLMDEPLSNLDAKLRLEMRAEIRRIHDAIGSTTIYVTHDQDEALSLADRIVVMREGAIRQVGAPAELYERPDHPEVAEFMGFRTRMTGRVIACDGDRALIETGGARIEALARETLKAGGEALVAIRPEDLVATSNDEGLACQVEAIEYRGRAYFGLASTTTGDELYFRSDAPLARGAAIRLAAAPDRAVAFSGRAG
jgi:putative spermidine/putrescine transport system ATP-binding protein